MVKRCLGSVRSFFAEIFLAAPSEVPEKKKKNVETWSVPEALLVGGLISTHLKNMQPSNWIISPGTDEISKNIWVATIYS